MTKISKYYQRKYGLQEEVPAADLASSGSGEVKLSKYYQRKYGLLGNSEQVENRDWAEGKPEQPKVTQPRFTWDVPADAATIDKRFQAVSPAQFQQNQQLLRKYGGNYENYLNDNRRNFSSAAEYEQTVARARQYNSSVQLQSAQTRVANAEKAAQDVAVEAERIQRSAENLQGLYDRYQQTGDVTDGQTYLLAAQAHKQALEAYQEKYKAYEKEWDDAYKAYDTARSRAEKDQAAYLKASERYQQEMQAQYSNRSTSAQEERRKASRSQNGNRVAELDIQIQEAYDELSRRLGEETASGENILDPLRQKIRDMENERNTLRVKNAEYDRQYGVMDKYQPFMLEDDFAYLSAVRPLRNPTRDELLEIDAAGATVPVIDRLGLFLSASKREKEQAMAVPYDQEGTWETIIKDGFDGSWDKLEKDEIRIYYYLLNKYGAEEAEQYLDDMKTELNRRSTVEREQFIDNASGMQKLALNMASVPSSVLGGVTAFVEDAVSLAKGKDINPYSAAHAMSNDAKATRASTARSADEMTRNAAFLGITLGDAYQAVMSGADSLFGGVMMGATGYGVAMGMGAASTKAREMYEQGATNEQIAAGSLLAGTAEMVFEKYSIEKLFELKDAKTVLQVVKNALIQGGVEASEEAFTEIANTITDTIVRGNESEWSQSIRQYMAEGKSEKEATALALLDVGKNVWKAGAGGFISGVLMGGTVSAINYDGYRQEEMLNRDVDKPAGVAKGITVEVENDTKGTAGSDRTDVGNLQTVGDLEEQKAQATTNPENARPIEGIQWAGNTKEIETEVMNNERTEPRTVDQSGSRGQDTGDTSGNGEKNPRRAAARALGRRAEEARRVQANVQAVGGELTSLQALGMKDGSEEKNIRIVSREAWTPDVEEAWEIADSEGLEFVPISGQLRATAQNGNEVKFVAAIQNGMLYAQADSMKQSIREATMHEVFHEKVRKDPVLRDRLIKQIKQTHAKKEIEVIFERYYQDYQKAYGGTMTDEELDKAVWEEMLADAYAELQRYSDTFGPAAWSEEVQETVWDQRETKDNEQTRFSLEGHENDMDLILADGVRQAASMEPAAQLDGTEFAKGEKNLVEQVADYFDSIGNRAVHPVVGIVELNRRGVKDDIAHGIGRKKAITFRAVPDVIEKGGLIDYRENWKGRGYDTAVIAAPVTIAGKPYMMGVVLNRYSGENQFYVHEVLAESEEGAAPFKTGTIMDGTPGGDTPSVLSLLQNVLAVKNNGGETRFSIDKEEIQLKAGRELAQGPHVVPRTVVERSEHIFRPDGMSDAEYADLDAKWQDRKKRTEERPESALEWIVPKKGFQSTPAMEKLGIRVDGSVTRYRETAQLRAYEKAAVEANRLLRKRAKALKATDQEEQLAREIADGLLTPDALNADKIDIDTVTELADYVMAARAFNEDMIARRRSEINGMNYQIADELFQDSEAYHPKLAYIPNLTKLVMNERTPERVAKQIFGEEQGGKIYETYFRPVWVNGAEMYRFENRMLQRVEQFEDQNGVKRKLTEQEREFAQRLMEGEAVQENLRRLDADTRERVVAVAQNVNNGMEFVDAVREHGLTDEYHMGLAQAYADYLVTETLSKDMDRTILANAIREYQAIYNELYEAINDFLVSHGYHEIGFIQGYAPHFQKREVQQGLFGALKSLGVEKESVSELPASIAGRTADFKPNMKWNPHMQTRKGTKTDYDIQEGFEQYLHYVAEMFYHTDDVMRVRQAVNWFRGQYSGDEIRMEIEDAEVDRYKSTEWKKEFLKEKGILGTGDNLDARTVETMYDEYVSKLFDRAKPESLQKYSEFVTWMDNYANIVAGKQSMGDRAIEDDAGRIFLNVGNKLMQTFTKANVAGNLSSVLNQSAQLPLIQQQLGTYMERAIFDMARGGLKKDSFAERSDFLTDKRGVEKLTMGNYEKVISTMFKPAEMMDRLVSTIAVRGRYLQALDEGMDIDQAMKEADDFGRRVMGSRMKGAKPLAFERKGPINQMLHVFQVEASNTFDYMFLSDMPQAVKQVAKEKGKAAAGRYTAAAVVGYLLNAFLLNRLTDFIYGGTPAPFDLMGWFLEFVAGGWGRSDEEYLKTLIDNGWETMFQERPFETERIDTSSGLDWAGSMKNLGYNILNDVPYVRNAAGVMGLGDQSLPTVGINEFFKNLGSAGVTLWNQAVNGEEETGLDWAGAAMSAGEDVGNAAVMLMPGGRQMKKAAQGIAAMIRGGAYTGYGDNQRLKYPVEQNILNAIRAGLFGMGALDETDAYYAGGSSLTAEQTKRVKELEDLGVDRFTSYGLYQDFREINQKMTGAEAKTAKREAIDGLPLEDAQKLELYMKTMVGDKGNPEKTRQKYQELLDEGVSWHQLTQLDNAITQINLDEDDDGEPDLSALERGIAKRNEIAAMDLSSWKKLEVFDQYVLDRTAKNYEKIRQEYEAMLDAGLSWEDVTRAHNTYAELEADEELNATQKATEYAKWADEQSWNAGQKKAIKERYKFWQMIPAEATTYEKFTDAGLSSDSSDVVTKLLASLEPEAGKDAVSINQKILAIDGSSLSKAEKTTAIAAMKPEQMDKLSEVGVSNSTAEQITAELALEEAKNGDDNLSTIRRARISVDAAKDNDEAMAALSVIVSKDTYPKIQMVAEYGVKANNWVEFKELWADWYGEDSVSQEKVENVLDDMYLTKEQKAALWQISNKSWKPKNNPYSRKVGEEIYDALNEE